MAPDRVAAILALLATFAWSPRGRTDEEVDTTESQSEDHAPADLDLADCPPRPRVDLARGAALYQQRCAVCHGATGRGDGPTARHLDPPPRDLTRGSYKLRTTATGELPTDQDIFRTLTRGIRSTAMPPWSALSAEDRWQLVAFLETLSERFMEEEAGEVITVPDPLPETPELIERGRLVYNVMKCGECHGASGRGDGPAARTLRDIDGRQTFPFDMTRGYKLKGGTEPRDVYRTFHTGLDGTPMPSYHGILSDRDNWALVHYVRSLFVDRP